MERTLRRRAAAAPGVGSILVTSAPAVEWLAVDHGTALFFGGPTPFLLARQKKWGREKAIPKVSAFGLCLLSVRTESMQRIAQGEGVSPKGTKPLGGCRDFLFE